MRLQVNIQVVLFSLELSLRHVMVRAESCLSCTVCHVLVSFITTKVDIRSHILQIKKERDRTQTLKFPTFTQLMGAKTRICPVLHHLQSSLKLPSIESVMPSSHRILCRPLLPLPSIFPSCTVHNSQNMGTTWMSSDG